MCYTGSLNVVTFNNNGIEGALSDYTSFGHEGIDNCTAQADQDESNRADKIVHGMAQCEAKKTGLFSSETDAS